MTDISVAIVAYNDEKDVKGCGMFYCGAYRRLCFYENICD